MCFPSRRRGSEASQEARAPRPIQASDSDSGSSSEARGDYSVSPQKLGAQVLEYYQFLAKLHVRPENLKVPPPGGWRELTNEHCANFKSQFALDTMRHLPYISGKAAADSNSYFFNYLECSKEYFLQPIEAEQGLGDYDEQLEEHKQDVVFLTRMWPNGGIMTALDTRTAELFVIHEGMGAAKLDLDEYIDMMKDMFTTLKYIPGKEPKTIIRAEGVKNSKRGTTISETKALAQTAEFPSTMDVQYIRQVYKEHGWPENFKRDEAFAVIDRLVNQVAQSNRGEWDEEYDGDGFCGRVF